jgi:hypothetical protein
MRRLAALLGSGLVLVTAPAWAAEPGPVNSDRPGIGTGAETVGRGAVHLETGVDHVKESRAGEPTMRSTALAATVRFGITDRVELRLDGQPIVVLRGADDTAGTGDLALGAKIKLLEGGAGPVAPVVSIFPSVKVPTGRDPIGGEKVDATLLGLATFSLGADLSLDVNAGVALIGQRQPAGYLVQGQAVTTLNWAISPAVAVFGEVFYASRAERDGTEIAGAGSGVTYTLTRDLALDAAVLTTLTGQGPDYRLQAGVTVRFWP